jgi:hypothetical protein
MRERGHVLGPCPAAVERHAGQQSSGAAGRPAILLPNADDLVRVTWIERYIGSTSALTYSVPNAGAPSQPAAKGEVPLTRTGDRRPAVAGNGSIVASASAAAADEQQNAGDHRRETGRLASGTVSRCR